MRKFLTLFTVLVGLCLLVHAQTRKLSGKVLDDKGNPIPYATVKIKGKNSGVSADQNGLFEVQVSPKDVLAISAVGYDLQEVAAGANATVSVALKGNKLMQEIIVTAQGIRRRPRELGFSAARVSNEDIMVGRSPQLAQSLSGKVSGLTIFNVNNSVDPSYKFTLRGYRSITGSNDALVVIDGMPFPPPTSTDPSGNTNSTNPLSLLNPNDIDNISVLKGGQAATLYGSDGVNGAIVITTKRGSKGKLRLTYSNATNVDIVSFLPEFQDKYGSGSHYAAGFGTAGWKPNYLDRMKDNWRSYENQQFGDQFDGSMRPVGRTLEDGSYNSLPYSAIDGERKRIWNKGFTTNNQVSLSGGSEQSSFYLSLENNYTEGVVPGDVSKRNGARFAGATEAGRIRAAYTLSYVQQSFDRTTFDFYNEAINQAANIPLSDMRDWRNNKFASPNAYYNDYYTNPYFRLDNQRANYKDANISGNIELNYKATSWLNFYEKFNLANNSRTRKNTVGQFFHSAWAKTKAVVPAPWDQGDGSGISRAKTDFPGSVYDATINENRFNNELQAQMNKDFGDFSVKGILGFSVTQNSSKVVEISSSSIVVPGVDNVSNRQGVLGGGESNTQYRKYGYYADLTVGWKDMLFVHAAGRYDFTSKFYKSYRPSDMYSYFYPGVDVSLILTELVPGLKGNNLLSYAKLRASINKNGNDNLGSASTLYGLDPTFTPPTGFPYGNTVGVTIGGTLPDSSLKPEQVTSWEVGGEFQLFSGRLSIDAAYYKQNSKGTVVDVTIPASTGYSIYRFNVGETKNWGYEIDLKGQIIRDKKFNWDLNFRYSYNDNKVVQLYPGVDEFSINSTYAYAQSYIIKDQPFPMLKAISYVRDPATNRVIVNKANGYPLTTGPLKNFGRTTPKYTLGAGTRLSYGDFTLTANFEYRGGNKIYSDLGRQMTFTGSGKWTEERTPHVFANSSYDDGTGKFVENTTVNVAEAEYALWDTYYRVIAENFVFPGWFIKMRDINLAYNVPSNLLSKTKVFGAASIALYGRNLFTIVDKMNFYTDPEFSNTTGNGQGIGNTLQTPPVRQYGFNINITFK